MTADSNNISPQYHLQLRKYNSKISEFVIGSHESNSWEQYPFTLVKLAAQ